MGDQSNSDRTYQQQQHAEGSNSNSSGDWCRPAVEPVRSRWTPKPEQILILESIFNSGMVNPPKDETVRIRKLLEKFGAVGDANVFYWFQNRRSRSRRRQRQLQAASQQLAAAGGGAVSFSSAVDPQKAGGVIFGAGSHVNHGLQLLGGAGTTDPPTGAILQYEPSLASPSSTSSSGSSGCGGGGFISPMSNSTADASLPHLVSSGADGADDLFTISRQMGFPETGQTMRPSLFPSASDQHNSSHPGDLHYQRAESLTVFINGVASEIPRGAFDTGLLFGPDLMLVHSSGEIVPVDEYGMLFQGLVMGESYFLVPRHG